MAARGASALTADETRELQVLRSSVLFALRAPDRARVRSYERIKVGRDLLAAGEDAKVLALFARGVRSLPPHSRARLQELLGKAVASGLAPDPSTASATR
jgi:hypothetical protein